MKQSSWDYALWIFDEEDYKKKTKFLINLVFLKNIWFIKKYSYNMNTKKLIFWV